MLGKVNYSVSASMQYGQEGCGRAARLVFGASVPSCMGIVIGTFSAHLCEVPVHFWMTGSLDECLSHPWAAEFFARAENELRDKIEAVKKELSNV